MINSKQGSEFGALFVYYEKENQLLFYTNFGFLTSTINGLISLAYFNIVPNFWSWR